MKGAYKGLIVAAVQILIVASLGAKMLYDRSTRPRVWARVSPYDPELPIRGRYVSLQLDVYAVGIQTPQDSGERHESFRWQRIPVILSKEADRLVAKHDPAATDEYSYATGRDAIVFRRVRPGELQAVIAERVLFFIPEHIPDPSARAAGEELWVEVTLPRKGPPRPIRLAVKRADGTFTPLEIN